MIVPPRLLATLTLCAAAATAVADEPPLRVVELFTSHGCSSCPPADKLLGQLIEGDESLIALEYHVDYWNRLVHGGDGNWVDPFSDPAWTMRQREYDMVGLDGRRGVYTPQMIVNGSYAAVGSDAARVVSALAEAGPAQADVDIERAGDDYRISVRADMADGADILLVRFKDRASTEITAGENRHRTIVNHHIVMSVDRLGRIDGDATSSFTVGASEAGQGCAVLVQDPMLSPILGAAACP